MTATVNFKGQTFQTTRNGTKFVSFYSTTENQDRYMAVEHRAEGPARKGSWQSPAMKKIWIYRGYVAV